MDMLTHLRQSHGFSVYPTDNAVWVDDTGTPVPYDEWMGSASTEDLAIAHERDHAEYPEVKHDHEGAS